VLGEEHPDTLISMANLAYTLKDQSHDDEAIKMVTSCLELSMKVLGPSHPDTQSTLETLMTWLNVGSDTKYQGDERVDRIPGAWVD